MSLLLRNVSKLNPLVSIRPYSEVVNVFGRRNVDTKPKEDMVDKRIATIPENAESVDILSGYPHQIQESRKCRIFVMNKNAMQSGTYQTYKWKIEFDNQPRWENPLIGWGSTGDAVSNLTLEFGAKEDAIIYCQRMGFDYKIDEPAKMKKQFGKSYGANFSWNKRTRTSTK